MLVRVKHSRHTRNMIHIYILSIACVTLTLRFRSQLSFGHVSTQWFSTDLRIEEEKKNARKNCIRIVFFFGAFDYYKYEKSNGSWQVERKPGKILLVDWMSGSKFIHWFNLSRIRLRMFVHVIFFFVFHLGFSVFVCVRERHSRYFTIPQLSYIYIIQINFVQFLFLPSATCKFFRTGKIWNELFLTFPIPFPALTFWLTSIRFISYMN